MANAQRDLARKITALECGKIVTDVVGLHQSVNKDALIVGISGPPGAGKSVLVGQLAKYAAEQGKQVAVFAVDPSSPLTGGAILADRIRMPLEFPNGQVFIRSLASRGELGGVSRVVPSAVRAAMEYGYDVVIIETVGVGQNETDILNVADTVVIVQAPGAGDDIQGLKAGVLEIADLLVVNKCDLSGHEDTLRVAREIAHSMERHGWMPPVVAATAIAAKGVRELWTEIGHHHAWLKAGEELQARRQRRIEAELTWGILGVLRQKIRVHEIAGKISRGEVSLAAAIQLFGDIISENFSQHMTILEGQQEKPHDDAAITAGQSGKESNNG